MDRFRDYEIAAAESADFEAALRILFGRWGDGKRDAPARGFLAEAGGGRISPDGLFVARRRGELAAAVWGQAQPGAVGMVWPPALTGGVAEEDRDGVAVALLDRAVDDLLRRSVALVQAFLSPDDPATARHFETAGFSYLAELHFLVGLSGRFSVKRPESPLEFEPFRPVDLARMATVVERTYEKSLDCPAADGLRRIDDVLAGYRTTEGFSAECWLFARHDGRDVGCLLLADHHPGAEQWELVYMGVVPEARGRGFGGQIVRHGQWLTGRAGRERLVATVDAANGPAIAIYERAGFVRWDQRRAWVKGNVECETRSAE